MSEAAPPAEHVKLAYRLISPRYYIRYRAWRTRRRGEEAHEGELNLLPTIVPRDRVAIDVGANRGLYTFFLSRLARRTVAYEPAPPMALFLRQAKLPGVDVREAGVSNKNGEDIFFVQHTAKGKLRFNIGHLGGGHPHGVTGVQFPVKIVRLDDEGLSNVGFIKIDVEGHEWEVIDGARKLLARCRPNLIVEILEGRGEREIVLQNKTLKLLGELGYLPYVFTGGALRPLRDAALNYNVINYVFLPDHSAAAGETSP